jgi:NAD(P)H-nitrite reductase large subunit
MPRGATTPAELRRIAEIAEKYNVALVKVTGGQRIDLLGVRKEDLPAVWAELGTVSGHAYRKTYRTCKACVGTDFRAAGSSAAPGRPAVYSDFTVESVQDFFCCRPAEVFQLQPTG